RLRLRVARGVVRGGRRGRLGAQLLEPLLALAAVGAQRVELLYGPLAALEAARLLLDGGAHGRAPRLRLRQVVRLLAELLLALAQPLAVLHQRLPLVAQAREHALELRAQRPFAGRADALGPRLLQHPHLLLQLLPALAVRLEPRPHLLLLLHPVGKPIADLLLGRDQLALRLLQLTAVLLGERGCLLDRGEPPLTISQLAQQRFLAVQQRAPPLHQPRALRQLLALLHHGGEHRELLPQPRKLGFRRHGRFELRARAGRVPFRGLQLRACDAQRVRELAVLVARRLHRLPARRQPQRALRRRARGLLRLADGRDGLLPAPLRGRALRAQCVRVGQSRTQPLRLVPQLVAPLPRALLRDSQPLVAQHLAEEAAALRRAHLRQELELVLTREVGVEELLAAHPEPPLEVLRDAADRRGDRRRRAVQEHLGAVQRAHHAVLVAGQLKDQLDLHAAAAGRAREAQRVVGPADRGGAVDRPADRFQDRALARAV